MRSLVPFACVGLIATGATLAQDRPATVQPLQSGQGSNTLQDTSTTPGPLPRGTVVQVPGAHNAPFTQNGLTPGQPASIGGSAISNPAGGGSLVWDNGAADGANGYSNATVGAFGARRTLLDDFSSATGGTLGCIEWTHVFGSGEPAGTGTGAEFSVRFDNAGTPGAVGAVANVTSYTETATGGVFFSRPEVASVATIDPIGFAAGTYWIEGTVVAPVNNFWLTSGGGAIQGSECWINYDDLGGLQPGSALFGTASDINFQLFEGGPPPPPSCADPLLADNGAADGVNGYSNATVAAFGARRTLLDDFGVPAGKIHDLTCISWTHVFGSGEPAGTGTGAEFDFRDDAGGAPGAVIATANVTSYSEAETGGVFFSRPEVSSVATFDPISLGEGAYWFEGTIVAPVNNFWLTATQQGNECWINYDDLGGLQPGSALFGTAADVNFETHGLESDVPPDATCKIYDNGGPDGNNGYGHGPGSFWGVDFLLLDDFTVPSGQTWVLNSLCWSEVYVAGEGAGTGTGAVISFRDDAAGTPGATFANATVTGYSESETGSVYFSRPEVVAVATFDEIPVSSGTYWWEARGETDGTTAAYWLTAPLTGNECWTNYGGLLSGTDTFGVASDLTFSLGVNRIGTNYCPDNDAGIVWATGSDLVADQNVIVIACNLPANENGYLLNSMNTGSVVVPNSGTLCLGDGKGRHVKQLANSGPAGVIQTPLDLTALPRSSGGPATVMAGETWYFQLWHRDGSASNFTDAVCITFN